MIKRKTKTIKQTNGPLAAVSIASSMPSSMRIRRSNIEYTCSFGEYEGDWWWWWWWWWWQAGLYIHTYIHNMYVLVSFKLGLGALCHAERFGGWWWDGMELDWNLSAYKRNGRYGCCPIIDDMLSKWSWMITDRRIVGIWSCPGGLLGWWPLYVRLRLECDGAWMTRRLDILDGVWGDLI